MAHDLLRIKQYAEQDMTQNKLAVLLNVSRATLTRWSRYGFTGVGGRATRFILTLLDLGIIEVEDIEDYNAGRKLGGTQGRPARPEELAAYAAARTDVKPPASAPAAAVDRPVPAPFRYTAEQVRGMWKQK